jgi:membrane protein implicated in regulation of membrane protease activity
MMDWSASTLWWTATGVLVAAELATGTFYLLMLAVGTAAAALAAGLGVASSGQMIAGALIGGGAVAAWHGWQRQRQRRDMAAAANSPGMNLDLGERVMVAAWDVEGATTVRYRGSTWQARHRGDQPPQPGPHRIVAIESIHLVLVPDAP